MGQIKKAIGVFLIIMMAAVFFHLLSLPESASAATTGADRVFIVKSKRIMLLMRDGEILKAYRISLGMQPVGRKVRAGDKRTPEGSYVLDSRNPNSRFHLALHVSYPNESDMANARRLGVSPGGDIMIHGLSGNTAGFGELYGHEDWTNGCIAVTNAEIEEIWKLVPDGTPIEIKP